MDSHSMSISYDLPSSRDSSRIYRDLAACKLSSGRLEDKSVYRTMASTTSMRKKESRKSSSRPKIGIVGAGISGLRCADILLQHGFDVTILEARDRIGGRMHQVTLPSGHVVDLGPNWIHGTVHNPILDLVKQTNTETHSWGEKFNVFGENGNLLHDGRSLGDIMWGIIVQAFKHSAENSSTINPQESLYDYFETKIEEAIPPEGNFEEKRKIVMQLSQTWGAFVGSPVTRQSLKFFWLEECIDGENLFCAGTYQKVLALIAKPALDGAKLMLSTKVTRIATMTDKVKLTTDDGTEHTFDQVVITNPLGWLKHHKEAFQPPLPDRFRAAIDATGYGSLEKVYITFPRSFWLESLVDSTKEEFTGFTQFLAPKYAMDTNPNLWIQECVDYSTLPESCRHPTLLFYIYGDQSKALAAELAALSSEKEREAHLVKFYKPYYSLLPHYQPDNSDCTPVSCTATSWVRDEFAGYGSYSNFMTGLEEGDRDIEVMREGLPERNLWFSGEHTAPFLALGTVTGAYWSGEAVGKRIAEEYGTTGTTGGSQQRAGDTINSHGDSIKEINIRGFGDKALDK